MKALAYLRTSSAQNLGDDKDSGSRQRSAIDAYAAGAGIEVVGEFYDAAVSGSDPIDQRPGFTAMLAQIAGNGVRMIIVENSDRFARDLIVQETGFRMLQKLGITLISAASPNAFIEDTPTAKLIRQVIGAVAEFNLAEIKARLRSGRAKKRRETGRCGGLPGFAVERPATVREAKRLRRRNPATGHVRSLREISKALADLGHLNGKGKPYGAQSVADMLATKLPAVASHVADHAEATAC